VSVAVTADCDTTTGTPVLLQADGTAAEQSVTDASPGTNSVRYAGMNIDPNAEVTADILIRVPLSVLAQLRAWLADGHEITPEGLGEGAVNRMLTAAKIPTKKSGKN
jgi:hypothetical protein